MILMAKKEKRLLNKEIEKQEYQTVKLFLENVQSHRYKVTQVNYKDSAKDFLKQIATHGGTKDDFETIEKFISAMCIYAGYEGKKLWCLDREKYVNERNVDRCIGCLAARMIFGSKLEDYED